MSNDLTSLNEEHVRQLGRIIETLEKSTFDYLQIEVGDMKVTVGKGNAALAAPSTSATSQTAPPPAQAVTQATAPSPAPAAPAAPQAGTVEIVSPLMGMFYAQAEPGAAPFVTVGAQVSEDSTVGLVEVMKTFNAVSAGVRGTIVEICARDAQIVEYGQVLFRVRPD